MSRGAALPRRDGRGAEPARGPAASPGTQDRAWQPHRPAKHPPVCAWVVTCWPLDSSPAWPLPLCPSAPRPPTRVRVDGDLLALEHRNLHVQHHHARLKPAGRRQAGARAARRQAEGSTDRRADITQQQQRADCDTPAAAVAAPPAHHAHLSTRGTGKSGWHSTLPAPTALASTPPSVTSALSPARARLAGLPSTSRDLRGG